MTLLTRLRTFAIVSLLMGALLLTAACGGSDGDDESGGSGSATEQASSTGSDAGTDDDGGSSGSSAPDPCSLITAADLQDAWGVEFGAGEPSETTPPFVFKTCGFGQTSNEPPARTLTVQVIGEDGIDEALKEQGQTPETMYEGQLEAATDAKPLAGLGDEAYQVDSHIAILKDGLYVSIDAPGASSTEALAGLQQVAEVVASNL